MDLYKILAGMRCFTREDLVKITGSESAAAWQISRYLEKGYIERVRRDLYAVISLETEQPIPNRYQIASVVAEDACVSHHSAFEYYGYANQVFYEMYIATKKRVRDFSYDGIDYHCIPQCAETGIEDTGMGVRVTSLERTVVDSMADFKKIGGLEELLRCLMMVPSLSSEKLLECLEAYGLGRLYQEAGYILESFRDDLNLPESFFRECEKHMPASKSYLTSPEDKYPLCSRWDLYAPENLRDVINKGVVQYDAT